MTADDDHAREGATGLAPPRISEFSPEPTPCQPPAVFRDEVARYDTAAQVGEWSGPRYRMTYRVLGDGPPLLWVPGIASTYRIYALVLNQLAEKFQTIQYTYPGDLVNDGAQ